MRIDDDVMQVLERATCRGDQLTLPDQLDRKLYERVAKVLTAMDGKWNRAAKATVFPGDAGEIIAQLLDTGEYTRTKQDMGQFDTPPAVVTKILALAGDLSGKLVLEPSAGIGNIAVAAQGAGAIVRACEIDRKRHAILMDRLGFNANYAPLNVDFLQQGAGDAGFDVVLMNPPFAKQADIAHVLHAATFLKPGGRLVSVMSAGVLFRENRQTVAFRAWVDDHDGEFIPLPDGAFAESGTQVRTCILQVTL